MSATDPAPGLSILFTGASRSGKSALALKWAEHHSACCVYLATGYAHDAEMQERIALHRAERGPNWSTLELSSLSSPLDLCCALRSIRPGNTAVVVDCTTLWLAALVEKGLNNGAIMKEVEKLASVVPELGFPIAFVHNETGWGIVPEHPLGRRFRDISGLAGQCLAAACDSVVLAVCGLPVVAKGSLGS